MAKFKLPPWIDTMIGSMAEYVHDGCSVEEAKEIGEAVGKVAATLCFTKTRNEGRDSK